MRRLGQAFFAAGLAAAGTLGAYQYLLRRPLPRTNGRVEVPGLERGVEVLRDRWGVPHIYASTRADLFFAQGYIHAQDRLFQMEVQRRLGAGRLAEIAGEAGLESDRLFRRVGLWRAAVRDSQELRGEAREAVAAYCQGVNAFIEKHRKRLPLEFGFLRFRPEPWAPADCLVWGNVLAWGLSVNWESEILRARMVALLGPEKVARLEAGYPPGQPLIVPPGVDYRGLGSSLLEEYQRVKEITGLNAWGIGSNNWAVDGHRSVTGRPLLANDPHLPPLMPSIWYEVQLCGPDFDVVGASFPGAPGVVIGHNQRIAWGVTNAQVDVQDLYLERFDPQDPSRYEFAGGWEQAEVVREEIAVRGQQPVVEEVRITRHGPVLTPIFPVEPRPLALRWTGLDGNSIATAVLKLNQAGNWQEFCAALRYWTVPAQNFVYADVDGNIGYYLAGKVPIRARGQGLLPVPGWSGEYEWTGYIPFEELPQAFNPPSHYVASANNRPVDDDYPYYLGQEWIAGYRAKRIGTLLTAREKLSVQDFKAIQADTYSLPGVEVARHMVRLKPSDPWQERALQRMAAWDGYLSPDSVAAAIYEVYLWHLARRVFGHHLQGLAEAYLGSGHLPIAPVNGFLGRSTPLLLRLIQERDPDWWASETHDPALDGEDRHVASVDGWDRALQGALADTTSFLRGRLGDRVEGWTWGRLHRVSFSHPLARRKPLHWLLSRGPHPMPGDLDTVLQGAYVPGMPFDAQVAVPVYRQIIDVGDWGRSVMVHAPGQSGHLGSPHYDDLLPTWLAGDHHPMLYDRADVERNAEARLVLETTGWGMRSADKCA